MGSRRQRRCDRARALDAAEQALAEIEAGVGAALIRVTEDGLSRNEAYVSLGLNRAVGRRLIELALTTRCTSADSSTGTPTDRASSANRTDRETGAAGIAAVSDLAGRLGRPSGQVQRVISEVLEHP